MVVPGFSSTAPYGSSGSSGEGIGSEYGARKLNVLENPGSRRIILCIEV